MKLQIEQAYVEAMVEEFPALAPLKDQLRLGDKIEVSYSQLSNPELTFLKGLYQQAGPAMQARRKIWKVMTEQFALDVDAGVIDELVAAFPAATGRDIEGLAKLTAKFCSQKKLKPSVAAFKRCSIFRGMDLGEALEENISA
jgi:hypothetical protein